MLRPPLLSICNPRGGITRRAIDFVDGVIELEGYGFNLNSSMKLTWCIVTSTWRVNLWCPAAPKTGESALALIPKAAFDAKAASLAFRLSDYGCGIVPCL